MRTTFIFAVAAIVLSWAIDQARAADKIPAFDIARNCKAEATGIGAVYRVEQCTNHETQAKNELTKRWSQFSASQKKNCVETSSIGGSQSYIELLTCLEMASGQLRGPQQR
jgi:hypothetical protein